MVMDPLTRFREDRLMIPFDISKEDWVFSSRACPEPWVPISINNYTGNYSVRSRVLYRATPPFYFPYWSNFTGQGSAIYLGLVHRQDIPIKGIQFRDGRMNGKISYFFRLDQEYLGFSNIPEKNSWKPKTNPEQLKDENIMERSERGEALRRALVEFKTRFPEIPEESIKEKQKVLAEQTGRLSENEKDKREELESEIERLQGLTGESESVRGFEDELIKWVRSRANRYPVYLARQFYPMEISGVYDLPCMSPTDTKEDKEDKEEKERAALPVRAARNRLIEQLKDGAKKSEMPLYSDADNFFQSYDDFNNGLNARIRTKYRLVLQTPALVLEMTEPLAQSLDTLFKTNIDALNRERLANVRKMELETEGQGRAQAAKDLADIVGESAAATILNTVESRKVPTGSTLNVNELGAYHDILRGTGNQPEQGSRISERKRRKIEARRNRNRENR